MADTAHTQIVATTEVPLVEKERLDLFKWLNESGCDTLIKLVESRVRESTAKAFNSTVNSEGRPGMLEDANEHLANVRRYTAFLDILKEIHDHKGEFIVTKWK